MSDIDKILEERGRTHGHWPSHARVAQSITQAVLDPQRAMVGLRVAGFPHDAVMREGVQMIAHKLGRIAVGDPTVEDHWDDIAGYATLVATYLRNRGTLDPAVVPHDPDAPHRAAVEHALGVRASRKAEEDPWRDPWNNDRPGRAGYGDEA